MIIATRILRLADDPDTKIPVRIFAPEEDDRCWICRFEIGWPDEIMKRYAAGEDSMQALELTMKMIGVTLYASELHEARRLMWEKLGDGYGFPVTTNSRDVLEGSDAQYM